jgi:hypothetical protein
MRVDRAAPLVGIVACLATVVAMLAPYVLLVDPGTGLDLYYASGPTGAGVVGFLALVAVIVFLAGRQGRTDPDVAAGITVVVGLSMLGLALVWATTIDPSNVYSFTASWMEYHRWLVVAGSGVVAAAAVAYARAVV